MKQRLGISHPPHTQQQPPANSWREAWKDNGGFCMNCSRGKQYLLRRSDRKLTLRDW